MKQKSENLAVEEYEEVPEEEYVEKQLATELEYDPNGADRVCRDFSNAQPAQEFYLSAGGHANDPHNLNHDNDGNACNWN